MNFLSRLLTRSQREFDDPIFGHLRQRKDWWLGETVWLNPAHMISVSIEGSDEPSPGDRTAFLAVREKYGDLLPLIGEALFELWGKPDASWEGPNPSSSQELLALLELDCVFVKSSGRVELLYGFAGDVWPDAMLTVAVEGGRVKPVSFDD
jgi:hypothetical protein